MKNVLTSQEITSKTDWEKKVSRFQEASFLQSWNWGDTHARLGKKVIRLQLSTGIAQFIKETGKRATYLTCPGGPLIFWDNKSLHEFTQVCRSLANRESAKFVRIRPQVPDNSSSRALVRKFGFILAPMHMHAETTLQLDLAKTEADLLAGMRKTTRYLIKKGLKMGIRIEKSTDPEDINTLYELEIETAKRQNFVPFPLEFLKSHFEAFRKDNQIQVFNGIWQNQVISSALIVFFGNEAVYHYSGSSSLYPHVPVNYLLQWEAIKEAKNRQKKVYNFWGVAKTDSPRHRFAGVTTFKTGFGGKRVDYLPAYDLPTSLLYWPNFAFESLRRIYRGL